MRIIAGTYKHRLIDYPENNPGIRPTKDRIREAIFSALGDINNKVCLDLYAGSGAMGLEAISRGVKKVFFNDNNKTAISIINKNIGDLAINSSLFEVFFNNDIDTLNNLKKEKILLDIVFLDPPYKENIYEHNISYLLDNEMLSDSGIIVCESNHKLDIKNENFHKIKEYKYGDIFVTICWR